MPKIKPNEAEETIERLRKRLVEADTRSCDQAKQRADLEGRVAASTAAYLRQRKESNDKQTVLNLAIERQRQRCNDAITEYDAARGELSRLTGDPTFALIHQRCLMDLNSIPATQ